MADKPSIPRVPKSAVDIETKSTDRQDRSWLARLYPEPKTYEQRREDDKRRQEIYRSHLSKHPHLTIALRGSIVFGLVMWFVQNLNAWWFSGGDDRAAAMSNVFLSFLVGGMVMFLAVLWIKYVNKQLYGFQSVAEAQFWLVYSVLIAGLIALWSTRLLGDYTNIAWVPTLVALHFTALFVGAKLSINDA